jgi:hypothetical protein
LEMNQFADQVRICFYRLSDDRFVWYERERNLMLELNRRKSRSYHIYVSIYVKWGAKTNEFTAWCTCIMSGDLNQRIWNRERETMTATHLRIKWTRWR